MSVLLFDITRALTPFSLSVIVSAAYMITVITVIGFVLFENRNPVKSLAWVSILLLLPGLGLLIYFVFGRSMRNRHMISRRKRRVLLSEQGQTPDDTPPETASAEAHRLVTINRSLTGSRYYEGCTCEIFTDGRSKFDAMIADLAAARSYIILQYYIFEDDGIGSQIADLLCEKARAGVRVRVMYDHLGSFGVRNSFFRRMTEAGVEAEPFFKLGFPHFTSRLNWRNHRKLCVIDGVTGYVGGMNIADRYIDGGKEFATWRDTHLRVTGPVVAAMQYSFAVDWNFIGKPLIEETPDPASRPLPRPEADCIVRTGMQLVSGGPTNEWCNMEFFLLAAIAAARKRVFIQTPYFLPSESLLRALQSAALARVDVRVMIPVRSDSAMLTYASRSYITESLRAGIKIFFYKAGMLHAKSLVIDDDISSVGSTNFDFRSLEHNFECNMIICSAEVNRRLRHTFMHDQQQCERIRFNEWRKRPLGHRFLESLVRLLSPIL